MCSGNKFYSLSEEILTLITEDVICVNWEQFPVLKALRLVSPRFAYLKRLQDVLFAKIQITPTPTHLKSLEDADMRLFGPSVKKINFVAPSRSWMLGYDEFEKVVVGGADGASHFSKEQVQAGFQDYCAEAEAVKSILHSDALRVAWTRALKTLPCVRSFRFSSSKWDKFGAKHFQLQPGHGWDFNWGSRTYQRALAVVGDAVLSAGIECLSEAGVEIEALKIESVMTTSSRWQDLPGWNSLNLTPMRRLKFEPWIEAGYEKVQHDSSIEDHIERSHAEGTNAAVASVMKKSASHLEYLRYDGHGGLMIWPGDQTVSLPRMLRLELKCGRIEAPSFKKWMACMPSLQELFLQSLSVTGYYTDWLIVFDAIRDHPKGLHVCFDQIHNCHYTELSIDYHTDDYEQYLNVEEADNWIDDDDRSLALYLSGKGGYNRPMHDMLEDHFPTDEDEDEDENEEAEDEYAKDGDLPNQDSNNQDSENYIS